VILVLDLLAGGDANAASPEPLGSSSGGTVPRLTLGARGTL
jgi:hypothetical protein